MSEDSFLKKLKGFTPDSSGMNRDFLMFAAGQASARNERRGTWLVVALATSQMISWVLLTVVLWPGRGPAVGQIAAVPPDAPAVAAPKPRSDPPDGGKPLPPALLPDDLVHRENRIEFVRKNRDWLIENLKLVEPKGVVQQPAKSGEPEHSFEVTLLDGRRITVRPKMEKLASYRASADIMEQHVRRRLAELFIQNPSKANLFAGIVDPGPGVPVRSRAHPTIPGATQTVSAGEPLDQLAEVEITGDNGPQAADLERMVRIHWTTYGTVQNERGMPRAKFEKIFGVGVEVKAGIWSWSIGGCRVLARFDGARPRSAPLTTAKPRRRRTSTPWRPASAALISGPSPRSIATSCLLFCDCATARPTPERSPTCAATWTKPLGRWSGLKRNEANFFGKFHNRKHAVRPLPRSSQDGLRTQIWS